MRLQTLSLLLCVLCINSIQLYWADVDPNGTGSFAISGSTRGGTQIYLNGLGFSTVPGANQAFIGSYPCIIPAGGATATTLSCITTDSGSNNPQYDLLISVIVNGVKASLIPQQCAFTYDPAATPLLYRLFPTSAIGATLINFYGIPRITNLGDGLRDRGDINSMLIGSSQCSLFDLTQTPITNANALNSIACTQSPLSQAGLFQAQQIFSVGASTPYFKLQRSSFMRVKYHFAVLPAINTLTPNSGGLGGQVLQITGSGFSTNMNNITVQVDNTPCTIISSSLTDITCTLQLRTALPTSPSFLSGSGLQYTRYNISTSPFLTLSQLKANLTLPILQQSIKAQLQSAHYYPPYYAQVYKGYFVPPTTGVYTFRGEADDAFSFWLSTNGSSSGLNQLISGSSYTNVDNFYLVSNANGEGNVSLLANTPYYLEAYHINYAGVGNFRLSVEVPNTDTTLLWQTHAVQQLSLSITNDPQILQYNIINATTGILSMSMVRKGTNGQITYSVAVSIPYNANITTFLAALNNFDLYSPYGLSGQLIMYDSNNNVVNTSATAYKYTYIISINLLRPPSVLSQKLTYVLTNGILSLTTIKAHCPLMSGTFQLTLGGLPVLTANNSTAIPYNVPDYTLQSYIAQLPGMSLVEVTTQYNYAGYSSAYVISFYGYNAYVPQIIVNNVNLAGGKTNTIPSANVTVLRQYSPNLLIDPIDHNYLYTYSNSSSLTITVNNLLAVCTNNCAYTFINDNPIIQSATMTNNSVSINIVNNTNVPTSIVLGTTPCVNISLVATTVTCTLTTPLPSGFYTPTVTTDKGILLTAPTFTKIAVPLVLQSLSNSTGGLNGGYPITVTGLNFPTNIVFTLCNQTAQVLQSTSTTATILIPPCTLGPTPLLASTPQQASNALSFMYLTPPLTPYIESISPMSANPTWKGVMVVQGLGFGTNVLQLTAALGNASGNVYPLRILNANNTYLEAGIPGGLPGTFTFFLSLDGHGRINGLNASVVTFTYELLLLNLTPSTGSYFGGTLLHLQGTNFNTNPLESLVFIGYSLNQFCTIEQQTTTDILCRTPSKSIYYNVSQQLNVTLTNKLIQDSVCMGVCTFSYIDQQSSPQINSISPSYAMYNNSIAMVINTTVVPTMVVLTNIKSGAVTLITPTSINNTVLMFTLPNVESGMYGVQLRCDPIGYSNAVALSVSIQFDTITHSYSLQGGNIVIGGSNLPTSWPNSNMVLTISIDGNIDSRVNVVSCTPNTLTLQIPPNTKLTTYTISITTPTVKLATTTFTQNTIGTPTIVLLNQTAPIGLNTIYINRTVITVAPQYIYLLTSNNLMILLTNYTVSGTMLLINHTFAPGSYQFKIHYADYGWSAPTASLLISTAMSPTVSNTQVSFNGGLFYLTSTQLSEYGHINVNGFNGTLTEVTAQGGYASIPPLITPLTQKTLKMVHIGRVTQYTLVGDNSSANSNAFDGLYDSFYTSTNTKCYIGVDVGSNLALSATKIRYFPYNRWAVSGNYLNGGVFQASNDSISWVLLSTLGQSVHSGWNSIQLLNTVYRYYRFRHTNQSKCQMAELQFYGVIYTTVDTSALGGTLTNFSSLQCNITYSDGYNTFNIPNAVTYAYSKTAIVSSVVPANGDVFGGYNITLSGVNLAAAVVNVEIDGVQCVIHSASDTNIICTVGSRLALPSATSFVVTLNNVTTAVIEQSFVYVLRWSDVRTWGTDLLPQDGDLIDVPLGMNLYVDVSTPKVKGILVHNGTITFADESDIVVTAGFITVVGGTFLAGTESNPYQHRLTFVMTGSYYGPQQPMFGNKGIGCLQCTFSMYGVPRTPTWTTIASTINRNTTTFNVSEDVDWRVNQNIVVASTSYDHNQAQEKTIVAISGRTITVDSAFTNMHFSGVETHGVTTVEIRAEVGLLNRNIVMMGDNQTEATMYGSHLMMAGTAQNGLLASIAYTQFTQCGQPRILGRYCIHFHMNGDMSDSYVKGNVVHHSHARVVAIHGTSYLTIQNNVGYRAHGHNYFLEDGIQTHNILQHNLAISSLSSFLMLQTDISVASYWITHPTNDLFNNVAAGSDFYGFWYEIKPHPDGPSATSDICPIGNPLGTVLNNIAHSNVRFGLRVFMLSPSTYPCQPVYTIDAFTPFLANPPIFSTFSDLLLYKNQEAGLLSQLTQNVFYTNIIVAESKIAGMEFYVAPFAQVPLTVSNSTIIGQLQYHPQSVVNAKGIITPRTGTLILKNILFVDYPPTTTIMVTCSKCDGNLYTNSAQEIFTANISLVNVSGAYLRMLGLKREIIYDSDGSFSMYFDNLTRTAATIVNAFSHLLAQSQCVPQTNTLKWDTTLICNSTLTLRKVSISSVAPTSTFNRIAMKVIPISNGTSLVDPATPPSQYSMISTNDGNMQPMDTSRTYTVAYVTGRTYNIWWSTGIDFNSLKVSSSNFYDASFPAVVFKFNYSMYREQYEVGPLSPGLTPYLVNRSNDYLDVSACVNGDYYHDNSQGNRTLQLCAGGKNRSYFSYTQVKAIYCIYLCPAEPGQYIKETFVRYWSNASQWPNAVVPKAGDNVTVLGEWTLIMDMNPAPMNYFQVDGLIIIPDTQDITIMCYNMWIRAGTVKAGTASTPFTHSLLFIFNGTKDGPSYAVDAALVGNKMLTITGTLSLYGIVPGSLYTPLTSTAFKGTTLLTVSDASGWKVGDEIVLAATFSAQTQSQRVTITDITGNTVTFTPALKYTHYGDNDLTIDWPYGRLDTRGNVGHVTRNIKFISGTDEGWGYHIEVYSVWAGNTSYTGQLIAQGVEFKLGGQYNTLATTVHFNYVQDMVQPSSITGSSFSLCRSYCLLIENSDQVQVTDNVFFQARQIHMQATAVTNLVFVRNFMVGALNNPFMTGLIVACVSLYQIDPVVSNVSLNNNLCQGSQGIGFALPFLPCDSTLPNYQNNTAGSCSIGFLLSQINSDCVGFSHLKAYACNIGQMSSPPNTVTTTFSNFILADNKRGVTLRFGMEGSDKTAYLQNSYITAMSRPNCSYCYGPTAMPCKQNQAVRMLTTTINGETYPNAFGQGFDVICRHEAFDAKAFITNVTFDSYLTTYRNMAQCSNNVVFRPHSIASDLVGSHHLWNTVCTNCNMSAYAYFDSPNPNELGWSGGCGELLCTGKINYFIEDHTGTFLSQAGVLLPNNGPIGKALAECTFINQLNGFYCKRQDFAVLQYESIAADYNKIVTWPVNLTYGAWTSVTNAFKEWDWIGNEPQNRRLNRFISLLQLQQQYNMSFASSPSTDMRFQLQHRIPGGNASDWVILQIYYPFPNSIRVSVNDGTIPPITLLTGNKQAKIDTTKCGSNKFFYANYTIWFAVTGMNCIVRTTLTDSIQLTALFSIDINLFFASNQSTLLIDRMATLLHISDTSTIKIVGVYPGSTQVVIFIDAPPTSTIAQATNDNTSTVDYIANLNLLLNTLISNGSLSADLQRNGFGELLATTVRIVYKVDTPLTKTLLIIGVSAGAVVLVIIVGFMIYCIKKNKNQISNLSEVPQVSAQIDSIQQQIQQSSAKKKPVKVQKYQVTEEEIQEH